jgi:hypothetical protein
VMMAAKPDKIRRFNCMIMPCFQKATTPRTSHYVELDNGV